MKSKYVKVKACECGYFKRPRRAGPIVESLYLGDNLCPDCGEKTKVTIGRYEVEEERVWLFFKSTKIVGFKAKREEDIWSDELMKVCLMGAIKKEREGEELTTSQEEMLSFCRKAAKPPKELFNNDGEVIGWTR